MQALSVEGSFATPCTMLLKHFLFFHSWTNVFQLLDIIYVTLNEGVFEVMFKTILLKEYTYR